MHPHFTPRCQLSILNTLDQRTTWPPDPPIPDHYISIYFTMSRLPPADIPDLPPRTPGPTRSSHSDGAGLLSTNQTCLNLPLTLLTGPVLGNSLGPYSTGCHGSPRAKSLERMGKFRELQEKFSVEILNLSLKEWVDLDKLEVRQGLSGLGNNRGKLQVNGKLSKKKSVSKA